METLAVAISENPNKVASAIRAKLKEDSSQLRAEPVIDDTAGADLYIAPPCEGYVLGVSGNRNALLAAEKRIEDTLMAFDYENQTAS